MKNTVVKQIKYLTLLGIPATLFSFGIASAREHPIFVIRQFKTRNLLRE